ncbi:MAG TPA: energy-coupling factor ABC transporter permease [bacterium]|mgnify:FL=1|nr:energy-coupling factor ABC transporter permease [bacterium]HQP98510.1 energy-coupling factor ABC transporter permease [bacterium]
MHIPDGFLNVSVCAATGLAAVAGLGMSVSRSQAALGERTIPLMGITAAFIFAAQMINFPVAGGTSGHLLGGVLAAILLGPWAGALVIALVLVVQCFLFMDGGVLVLGANIFNMAIVGTLLSFLIYKALNRGIGHIPAAAVTAWLSVVLASGTCAVELGISGTVPMGLAIKAMLGWHIVIGIGEAIITCVVLGYVNAVRPDLITTRAEATT